MPAHTSLLWIFVYVFGDVGCLSRIFLLKTLQVSFHCIVPFFILSCWQEKKNSYRKLFHELLHIFFCLFRCFRAEKWKVEKRKCSLKYLPSLIFWHITNSWKLCNWNFIKVFVYTIFHSTELQSWFSWSFSVGFSVSFSSLFCAASLISGYIYLLNVQLSKLFKMIYGEMLEMLILVIFISIQFYANFSISARVLWKPRFSQFSRRAEPSQSEHQMNNNEDESASKLR